MVNMLFGCTETVGGYAGMEKREANVVFKTADGAGDFGRDRADDTKKVDPQQIARLQRMSENLHLVLRMAAMDMLREEDGGFIMEVGANTVRMPDAKTLFEAYLALDEMQDGDFGELDQALSGPWTQTAIQMVLSPGEYTGVWRALRMRIITEALPMLRKHGSGGPDERDSKFFTLLCITICDKVISTLQRTDQQEDGH